MKKQFEGYGVFIGKVVSLTDGLYRIVYEDGDSEDLETDEIAGILVNVSEFDEEFRARKKSLEELINGKQEDVKEEVKPVKRGRGRPPKNRAKPAEESKLVGKSEEPKVEAPLMDEGLVLDRVEASSVGKSDFDSGKAKENDTDEEMDIDLGGFQEEAVDGDPDSCSDSSEFVQIKNKDTPVEIEVPLVPPPDLPSSSGNVGVPEEAISYLFSVYTFLRKFSIQLYLSPFKLDDFVGSLNCLSSNTLIDAVHLSLMRALKRHLEMLSSDGAKLSLRCLRYAFPSIYHLYLTYIVLVTYFCYTCNPDICCMGT